jgi:hypothetical protein
MRSSSLRSVAVNGSFRLSLCALFGEVAEWLKAPHSNSVAVVISHSVLSQQVLNCLKDFVKSNFKMVRGSAARSYIFRTASLSQSTPEFACENHNAVTQAVTVAVTDVSFNDETGKVRY